MITVLPSPFQRRGDYLGKTVQVVPHVTDAVQDWVERVSKIPVDDSNECPDVCIIEVGAHSGIFSSVRGNCVLTS
jgi:CTP synthase